MSRIMLCFLMVFFSGTVFAQTEQNVAVYTIGVDDVIEIKVIQPDQISETVTVVPDGSISFPYIGTVLVKGKTLEEIKVLITQKLSDGYMKYPVVSVSLTLSRSRKFFVYGEVVQPGSYPLVENMTVLRAISMSGGFTKFGSSSRIKLLRQKENEPGYETIKINIKKVIDGKEDFVVQNEDIIVISEGKF